MNNGLDESQAGIKIARRNISNLRYATLMAENEEELKSLLMKVKEENEKDGSKITADGDCSHKIKRCLFLGRKGMTNLGSVLKSRDITLLKNVCIVKAMVFPVVMCRCESWTIKKAECQRIDTFQWWCWRRFFRILWTTRESNQSI